MIGWVGLILTCGAAACCVWMTYVPAVLIVSAGKKANSHTWMVQGVRRLFFDPVGGRLSLSRGGCSVTKQVVALFDHRGQSVGWTIRKVVHPTGSNHLVDNPQVEKSYWTYSLACVAPVPIDKSTEQLYALTYVFPIIKLYELPSTVKKLSFSFFII